MYDVNDEVVHPKLGTGKVLEISRDLVKVDFVGDSVRFKFFLWMHNTGVNPCFVHKNELTKKEKKVDAFEEHIKQINKAMKAAYSRKGNVPRVVSSSRSGGTVNPMKAYVDEGDGLKEVPLSLFTGKPHEVIVADEADDHKNLKGMSFKIPKEKKLEIQKWVDERTKGIDFSFPENIDLNGVDLGDIEVVIDEKDKARKTAEAIDRHYKKHTNPCGEKLFEHDRVCGNILDSVGYVSMSKVEPKIKNDPTDDVVKDDDNDDVTIKIKDSNVEKFMNEHGAEACFGSTTNAIKMFVEFMNGGKGDV